MIKKLLLITLPLAVLVVLSAATMSDNGKAARTGSPGELNCTDCHGDYALNSGGGSISISAPGMSGNAYTAGQTYNMSVTVSRGASSLFGVGIEALTSANTNAGTLNITDAASTAIKSATISGVSRRNIVHTLNGGATAGSKVFNFSWTAPASGTGTVTFYFAGAACNSSGDEAGDYVYTGSQAFTEVSCQTPAQPGAISGNVALCSGGSTTLSVAAVAGATSYTWTLPSGWSGSSTTESITVNAGASSGNISVTANNACGASPASTVAATGTTFSITTTPHDANCNGSATGSIDAAPGGGTAPYAYSWSPTGGTASSATGLIAGNYTVIITDANGCSSSATAAVWEPTPLIVDAGADQLSCGGASVSLTGSASGGVAPYYYSWSPSTDLSSATVSNPTANPPATTVYTLTLSDDYGCSHTSSVTVEVSTATTPTITLNTLALDASAGVTYQWYLNGNPIVGETNQSYTPAVNGNYSVGVTDGLGCMLMSADYNYTLASISSISNTTMNIFPNPASDKLSFEYSNPSNDATISVIDIAGRVVLNQILVDGKNVVEVSNLSEGAYFLNTQSGKDKTTTRVFISR